ncbi:MAG TPA: DUF1365 domain-containing protein [Solirubrobacteraceae bacterium]|nr:DUF1365 domain-containing protein [Solirubrobacteraceae bacterium]
MSPVSCLYEGVVRHRRIEPAKQFQHRIALAYLDLEELPDLLDGQLVAPSPGLVRFRRSDYHGDPNRPLDSLVRDTVEERTGHRPTGSIRLLTHLRNFGHCFNPVSFYYCLDETNQRLEAVMAEVTNTPWGERHAYVVPGDRGSFGKALHVSPFMGMKHTYTCEAPLPDQEVSVRIRSHRDERAVFEAGLELQRRELTRESLRTVTRRYPLATLRVMVLIYLHALGLRLAGAPVFAHPEGSA